MTQQEQNAEALRGDLGDENQFDAVLNRTDELVVQFFQLFTIKSGGEKVYVIPGEPFFISADV